MFRPEGTDVLPEADGDEARRVRHLIRELADPWSSTVLHTAFLTRREVGLMHRALSAGAEGSVSWQHRVRFWGGYPAPSRAIALLPPTYMDYDELARSLMHDLPAPDDPLVYLRATAMESGAFSHSDVLGSMLGLGLRRDRTGDIVLWEAEGVMGADLIVLSEVAPILNGDWTQIARTPIRVTPLLGAGELRRPAVTQQTFTITVSQPRLDSLVGQIFHLGRAEATRRISSGLIRVNGVEVLKPDHRLKPGDVLTAGRDGRAVLGAPTGYSKKGRTVYPITLDR